MYRTTCSPEEQMASRCCRNEPSSCTSLASLALFTISADLIAFADPRSSVSVRLLRAAVGALDTKKPRSTRGDAAFVLGTVGGGNSLHYSTTPAPSPSAMLCGCLCSDFVFDEASVCSHWPTSFLCKCLPNGNVTQCWHWPISFVRWNSSGNIFVYTREDMMPFVD